MAEQISPDSNRSLAERVIQLEISAAHQQRFIEQLNEVVVDYSRRVDALQKSLKLLNEQMDSLRQDAKSSDKHNLADEKPPHY